MDRTSKEARIRVKRVSSEECDDTEMTTEEYYRQAEEMLQKIDEGAELVNQALVSPRQVSDKDFRVAAFERIKEEYLDKVEEDMIRILNELIEQQRITSEDQKVSKGRLLLNNGTWLIREAYMFLSGIIVRLADRRLSTHLVDEEIYHIGLMQDDLERAGTILGEALIAFQDSGEGDWSDSLEKFDEKHPGFIRRVSFPGECEECEARLGELEDLEADAIIVVKGAARVLPREEGVPLVVVPDIDMYPSLLGVQEAFLLDVQVRCPACDQYIDIERGAYMVQGMDEEEEN